MEPFECLAPYLPRIFEFIPAADRHQAAREFRCRHTRWPTMVGDWIVSGVCEDCGHVIFEDEAVEGVELHRECLDDRTR